jgi:hypothetical protein
MKKWSYILIVFLIILIILICGFFYFNKNDISYQPTTIKDNSDNIPISNNEPIKNEELIIQKNYETLDYNNIGNDYGRLPSANMISFGSVNYGDLIKVVVAEYPNAIQVYEKLLDEDYIEPNYHKTWLLYSGFNFIINGKKGFHLWNNGNYIIMIETNDPTKVTPQVLLDDYEEKYPPYQKKIPSGVECFDTDGGLNYNVRGNVETKIMISPPDYCLSDVPDTLYEYYCDSGKSTSVNYKCPKGCKNGACIS